LRSGVVEYLDFAHVDIGRVASPGSCTVIS
jgi:hypothetical protein